MRPGEMGAKGKGVLVTDGRMVIVTFGGQGVGQHGIGDGIVGGDGDGVLKKSFARAPESQLALCQGKIREENGMRPGSRVE